MGTHSTDGDRRAGQTTKGLQVLRLQLWTVGTGTQIAASGHFEAGDEHANQALGSVAIRYPMLELPAVGQVVYALGDELKRNWARFGRC
jgi:hypothetical protein